MENENLHKEHRKRMREKLFSNGVESFHDHELLEMFLYSCNSRRNTNDTAHLLLKQFDTLHGVLTASPDALMSVEGVKEITASQIMIINEIMRRIIISNIERPATYQSWEQIGEYLVHLYRFSPVEEMYAILLDSGNRLIDCVFVNRGSSDSVYANIKYIAKVVIEKDASSVVISHNHPGGRLIASADDAAFTHRLSETLSGMGVVLLDHILVVGDKFTSIMHPKF